MSIECPAGEAIAEARLSAARPPSPGCLCRIEQRPVLASEDPSTLRRFCTAAYTGCPSWRTDKANTFAARLADRGGDWWQRGESGRIEYAEPVERQGSLSTPQARAEALRRFRGR